MSVKYEKKLKSTATTGHKGHCTCDGEGCDNVSKVYTAKHSAASLSISEQAKKAEGWAFTVGFFAMMLGPDTYCPVCIAKLASTPPSVETPEPAVSHTEGGLTFTPIPQDILVLPGGE